MEPLSEFLILHCEDEGILIETGAESGQREIYGKDFWKQQFMSGKISPEDFWFVTQPTEKEGLDMALLRWVDRQEIRDGTLVLPGKSRSFEECFFKTALMAYDEWLFEVLVKCGLIDRPPREVVVEEGPLV